MRQIPPLVDKRILTPAQAAIALDLLGEIDLLRLKTIARLFARGLPSDVAWDDLLQEALTRVLVGSRRHPDGVPIVAFLAGVMRSLRADHCRRALTKSGGDAHRRITYESDESRTLADPAPGPERTLNAQQQLAAVEQLFAGDPVALKIIAGLGEGLSVEQIRLSAGLSKTAYDSARKRMRRTLLREGLTCEAK
jgi:DNA-directed RNA polymerase specialized sigma24 family protein